ncbi:MAG: hypothetical protein J2P48_15825 [Alphaproteobacteria bacterium]|nr:hypothetical protein [Alphaproteobacteria bacterium]
MPAGACAFVHGLELRGDLLQCAAGRGSLDASGQANEPVVASLRARPVQQGMPSVTSRCTVRYNRSTVHFLACPRFSTRITSPRADWGASAARSVATIELGEDAVEMRLVTADAHFADRRRVARAQTGIAADAPAAACGLETRLRALDDQRALELRGMRHHIPRTLSGA